jgi:hypothetical protein
VGESAEKRHIHSLMIAAASVIILKWKKRMLLYTARCALQAGKIKSSF